MNKDADAGLASLCRLEVRNALLGDFVFWEGVESDLLMSKEVSVEELSSGAGYQILCSHQVAARYKDMRIQRLRRCKK